MTKELVIYIVLLEITILLFTFRHIYLKNKK